MFYSPLRYPGGKNKLAKFIAKICVENNINGHYVEPYAGGASVALFLLLEKKVSRITINDYDRSIYAFWFSILKHTGTFCKMIENTEVNIETWRKAKAIQKKKKYSSLIQLGFSTFFLNRVNMSGIIDGGVIGGVEQNGVYKMDCRFNKQELIKRIKEIAKYKNKIQLFNLDAVELIEKINNESQNQQTIFYFDPPYYLKGKSLYINHYRHDDHEKIGKLINTIRNIHWIVSYDNTKEINKIYDWVSEGKKIEYTFFHTAHRAKEGKEVLFFSDSLKIIDLVTSPVKQKV
jgi:DNA adenine methylase